MDVASAYISPHTNLYPTQQHLSLFCQHSYLSNTPSYISCPVTSSTEKNGSFQQSNVRLQTILYAKHSNSDRSDEKDRPSTNAHSNNKSKHPKSKNNQPKHKQSNHTSNNNKPPNSKKKKKNDGNKIKAEIQKSKHKQKNKPSNNNQQDWLNLIDPYQAGKKLRQNLKSLSSLPGLPRTRSKKSIFYLDDRIFDISDTPTNQPPSVINEELSQSSSNIQSLFENPIYEDYDLDQEDNAPEVLVVGATGEVGRKVVQRLVRDPKQRFRVRVLVRDLYSKTLNLLGSGVTYCQGDLQDLDSLEYAVTDVDKIVFCAGAPRVDEVDWREKFEDFVEENLEEENDDSDESSGILSLDNDYTVNGNLNYGNQIDWKNVQAMMDIRSKLAEQVDFVGMQNLLQAYQNVRFADYGTSQAAKRSLFKFQSRPEDFNLFTLEDDDEDEDDYNYDAVENNEIIGEREVTENDIYKENSYAKRVPRRRGTLKSQYKWMKNKFGHGVLTGRLPVSSSTYTSSTSLASTLTNAVTDRPKGNEAAIVSGRLRSREDPEIGLDLGNGFAGLLCRVCSDGRTYEAFIRTGDYSTYGVEYVCVFETGNKNKNGNKSRNKFMSLRLPFASFRPVQRRKSDEEHLKDNFFFLPGTMSAKLDSVSEVKTIFQVTKRF